VFELGVVRGLAWGMGRGAVIALFFGLINQFITPMLWGCEGRTALPRRLQYEILCTTRDGNWFFMPVILFAVLQLLILCLVHVTELIQPRFTLLLPKIQLRLLWTNIILCMVSLYWAPYYLLRWNAGQDNMHVLAPLIESLLYDVMACTYQ
jgi:hypothetical protein